MLQYFSGCEPGPKGSADAQACSRTDVALPRLIADETAQRRMALLDGIQLELTFQQELLFLMLFLCMFSGTCARLRCG